MRVADPVDPVDHPRRADQRVPAARHRRRPGMRLLAGDPDLVPALALRAGDDADRVAVGFEDRPLLDMRLEIGGDLAAAHRCGAGEADPRQFGAERDAAQIVGPAETVVEVEHAGERARAEHRRRKPRAFLVGPGDDLDRRLGLVAEIVEAADDFEPGQHPIGAVELAAGRLGVEMAAGQHRRQTGVAAGPAGKDVADPVDADGAAGFLAPADEAAPRFAVEIARGEPAHAALGGGADLGQRHQARPEPLAIYLEIAHPTPPPEPGAASIILLDEQTFNGRSVFRHPPATVADRCTWSKSAAKRPVGAGVASR